MIMGLEDPAKRTGSGIELMIANHYIHGICIIIDGTTEAYTFTNLDSPLKMGSHI